MDSGERIDFFDGLKFWETRSGVKSWTIDNISETLTAAESNPAVQVWRAVITLGEASSFSVQYTDLDAAVAASIQDSADGLVDKGQQSTEAIPTDIAAPIALS